MDKDKDSSLSIGTGTVLQTGPRIQSLLACLHIKNSRQESSFQRTVFQVKFALYCLWHWQRRDLWNAYCDLWVTATSRHIPCTIDTI